MSELLEQVERVIVQRHLLASGESALVAVSGGLDSMTLLHLLHRMSQNHGWRLRIGHFNHGLRGRSSNADEQLVRATTKRLGLKIRVGRGEVRSFARRHRLSIEMSARHLRHEFLARAALAGGCSKVILAHHADDQLELFFLRLFRGAGPEGLAGMKWTSPSPSDRRIVLVRPLLGIQRKDVEAFAEEERIPFRHDTSNDHGQFERNRIRHVLLPLLREQFQPALAVTVLRTMDILRSESDLVSQITLEWQKTGVPPFDQLPVAVQRRWLFSECIRLGIAADFEVIEGLRTQPGRELMVHPQQRVWRDQAGIVHWRDTPNHDFRTSEREVDLSAKGGDAVLGCLHIRWNIQRWHGGAQALPRPAAGCERFDADKVGAMVHLRHWRPGDRFQLIGTRQAAKLQNLFTNLKIPRARRVEMGVATTGSGEIFWVEGIRMAERFKIVPQTQRCLEWRWSRDE